MENLHKRKVVPSPQCSLCKNQMESTEHLLLLYPWTREIWAHPSLNIQPYSQGLSRIEIWLLQLLNTLGNPQSLELVASIFWCIWRSRNNFIFRQKLPDPTQTLQGALTSLNTYRRWNSSQKSNLYSPTSSQICKPPSLRTLKINIDVSFNENSMEGAIACICQKSKGTLVDGLAKSIPVSSASQAEYMALSETQMFLLPRRQQPLRENIQWLVITTSSADAACIFH